MSERQLDFFPEAEAASAKRLARKEHPATSHEAAEAVLRQLPSLRVEALALVVAHPGRTKNELAEVAGVRDPQQIGRRLSELVTDGKLARGPVRACSITGRTATTWLPVKPKRDS